MEITKSPHSKNPSKNLAWLSLTALGVVYGDIGTSPLYALRETIDGNHQLPIDNLHVYGALSLLFWSITILVSFKYVGLMLRADNNGEGGSMALLAKVIGLAHGSKKIYLATILGLFASSLFIGDSIITPAISVLSAVEGITVVAPSLTNWILPLTILILFLLFWSQKKGTEKIGRAFGPIMIIWFISLFILGLNQVINNPHILVATFPIYAINFIYDNPVLAFFALGTVFLATTGAEAIYADMGHFGKNPIRLNWYLLVMPSLLMNYFGQGAMVLANPATIENPFYLMAPQWARVPLIILATCATVIASQAVISGTFSVIRQASLLGYLPRMNIIHTSASERGQIYVPFINWFLCIAVILLVLTYKNSSNLASMYGIAVVTTMFIDTFLLSAVMYLAWKWKIAWVISFTFFMVFIYSFYLIANLLKVPYGGWLPLSFSAIIFFILITWKKGYINLHKKQNQQDLQLTIFANMVNDSNITRVSGMSVFMSNNLDVVPGSLLHNLKHNRVIHEYVVVCSVKVLEVPTVPPENRLEFNGLGNGFYTITLKYGFMQAVNVPLSLRHLRDHGLPFDIMDTSFFLSREILLIKKSHNKLLSLRWQLFVWMHKNATNASQFFHIPINRVVEIGTQIEI